MVCPNITFDKIVFTYVVFPPALGPVTIIFLSQLTGFDICVSDKIGFLAYQNFVSALL